MPKIQAEQSVQKPSAAQQIPRRNEDTENAAKPIKQNFMAPNDRPSSVKDLQALESQDLSLQKTASDSKDLA